MLTSTYDLYSKTSILVKLCISTDWRKGAWTEKETVMQIIELKKQKKIETQKHKSYFEKYTIRHCMHFINPVNFKDYSIPYLLFDSFLVFLLCLNLFKTCISIFIDFLMLLLSLLNSSMAYLENKAKHGKFMDSHVSLYWIWLFESSSVSSEHQQCSQWLSEK